MAYFRRFQVLGCTLSNPKGKLTTMIFTTSRHKSARRAGRWLAVAGAAALSFSIAGCVKKNASPNGEAGDAPMMARQTTGKVRPDPNGPMVNPNPPVPAKPTGNPLVGAKLFVDPTSNAMGRANKYRQSDPAKAAILDRIALQPQGLWMGEWNTDIFRAVEYFVERAKADGAVPIVIAYNIPHRDAGQYSKGGLSSKEAYQRWIRDVAAGIGDDHAVVVLEPDALGHFQDHLTPELSEERMFLLNDAVRVLRMNPNTAVYLDAGHARWVPAEEMSKRLLKAGIEYAHGFSLNTSNYVSTEENTEYGHKLSELVGGAHFVIDTSRNGNGPLEGAEGEAAWCNPRGRKIGRAPTTNTGDPLIDGYLWLKRPGESDGECNGGPKAGVFWEEIAVEQAQ